MTSPAPDLTAPTAETAGDQSADRWFQPAAYGQLRPGSTLLYVEGHSIHGRVEVAVNRILLLTEPVFLPGDNVPFLTVSYVANGTYGSPRILNLKSLKLVPTSNLHPRRQPRLTGERFLAIEELDPSAVDLKLVAS